MKIAVDARPLSHPTFGIGRYTESLLNELIPRGDDWYLYSDRPLLVDYTHFSNVTIRTPARVLTPGALWSQWNFVRWARQDGVDLFWSPRHHLPVFLPMKMKKLLTIHDLVWLRYPRTMKPLGWILELLLMPISLFLADRIVAVSKFSASEVSKTFHIRASRIDTIPQAAFELTTERESDLPQDILKQNYFLFVGTPEPRKNLDRLLKAYKSFLEKGLTNNPMVYIVGSSGWGSEISSTIKSLALNEQVLVLDKINDPALQQIYKHALALLLPSLYEGFGLPVLEAMSHGTPVITSDCSSLPEIAGEAAILVDPYDITAIAGAMESLHSDEALRKELSEKGLVQAGKFSWENSADRTMAVMKELAQG
jgi:glycosyltransferase involved in cell wall biosynthesis